MSAFPDRWKGINVVLAHDWLTGMRGGERVLELLGNGFPSAPVYTLIHKPDAVSPGINSHTIHASWLNRIPGILSHYRYWLPTFPSAIESLRVQDADLVLSTSHCVAKGLRAQPGTPHLCYCFTPMRYAWTFYTEYFGTNPLKAMFAKPVLARLRRWDRQASDRVTRFVAISKHVQDRIRTFYGRESDVVYPPVDIDRCRPAAGQHDGFDLLVSALVPYKRVDLAVKAYTRLGYPLKVVGSGSGLDQLRADAGTNVEFMGWQPDARVLELYQSCRMLIFPGEEDFGIVPLEAQACGKPVVAFGRGGALETIIPDVSGVFFKEQTEESLLEAVGDASARDWDSDTIRTHAETFGPSRFLQGMADSIDRCLAGSL